jgi:hypothetical protein
MHNVPSQITKVETTSDGGMKLTVHTNELQPSEKSELMQWHNKLGRIVFSSTDEITDEDIPDENN